MAVFFRQGHRHAEGHAARNDGDFVQRVGLVEDVGQEGVTTFVIRNSLALVVAKHSGLALLAHEHTVACILEVHHVNLEGPATNSVQGCLVNQIGKVGTAHAGRAACDDLEVDVR